MHSKISHSFPSNLRQRLVDRFGEHWQTLEWEFQDARSFLLLKLEVEAKFERAFSEKVERFIRDEMSKEGILENKSDYRWMLVLMRNGEVIDSLNPDITARE